MAYSDIIFLIFYVISEEREASFKNGYRNGKEDGEREGKEKGWEEGYNAAHRTYSNSAEKINKCDSFLDTPELLDEWNKEIKEHEEAIKEKKK